MQKNVLPQKRKTSCRRGKGHGRPIKGRADAFKKNAEFLEMSLLLQKGLFEKDDILCFRNYFKDLVVDRLYVVGIAKHQYQAIPFELLGNLSKMLEREGVEQKTIHNVYCMLRYWNQGDNRQGKKVDCRVSENCNAFQRKMAWKRALLDCHAACEELVKPVFSFLEKHACKENGDAYRVIVQEAGDYASVMNSVRIITELFEFLYIKALPSTLSVSCTDVMKDAEVVLSSAYSHEGEQFTIKNAKMKKPAYIIGMSAAIELYIYLHDMNN